MKPSPDKERQGQAEFYAGLTDGELEKIAADGASLTELAREALQEAIAKRGLEVKIAELPTGEDVMELRKLVEVARFRDLPDALVAKSVLDSAGLDCFMRDDNVVRMDWFNSNFFGGVKLVVPEEQAEAAHELLQPPESLTLEEE